MLEVNQHEICVKGRRFSGGVNVDAVARIFQSSKIEENSWNASLNVADYLGDFLWHSLLVGLRPFFLHLVQRRLQPNWPESNATTY